MTSGDVVASRDAMMSLTGLEEFSGSFAMWLLPASFPTSFLAKVCLLTGHCSSPSTALSLEVCSSLENAKSQLGNCYSVVSRPSATQGVCPCLPYL